MPNRALPQFPTPPRPSPKAAITGGAIAALAAVFAMSTQDAEKTVHDIDMHESGGRQRLVAFQDSVGIWTICGGIIRWPNGVPVKRGDRATEKQCHEITAQQILEHGAPLAKCLPQLKGRPNQARALIDLTFNAGVHGVCTGSIAANIRAGRWAAASQGILAWDKGSFGRPPRGMACTKKAGPGWSCRIPGLSKRRQDNKRLFDLSRPAEGAR